MKRREFLGAGLAIAADYALRVPRAKAATFSRVRPGTPGWPSEADWAALNKETNGRLSPLAPPKLAQVKGQRLRAAAEDDPHAVRDFVRSRGSLSINAC